MTRTLPHSLESERELVGGCLVNAAGPAAIGGLVTAAEFYHRPLGLAFDAICAVDAAGETLVAESVVARLKATVGIGLLRAVVGADDEAAAVRWLAELQLDAMGANLAWHARRVRSLARHRRMLETLGELIAAGFVEGTDPDAFIALAEERILSQTATPRGSRLIAWKDVLVDAYQAMEKRADAFKRGGSAMTQGIRTGLDVLDEMTGGLQPGELTILAARPAMGKTALLMAWILNIARRGVPALVFSIEMSPRSLADRALSDGGSIEGRLIKSGDLSGRQWMGLLPMMRRDVTIPLTIDESSAPRLAHVRAVARQWRATFPPDRFPNAVIGLDYLQIMGSDEPAKGHRAPENRNLEVTKWSAGLKAIARDLNVPVVALSQLNRGVESRADKRPLNSDLRDSGAIEQDADVIAFLYRDEVYNKESPDKGIAEIILGKQRNGPTGSARVRFVAEFTRFENLGEQHQSAARPPKGHPAEWSDDGD